METIALASVGGLAVALLIALVATRRGRKRARRRAVSLERDLGTARGSLDTAVAGEREAVWALQHALERTTAAHDERGEALTRVAALEDDLDDLRARLAAADADLTEARREADEARTEIVRLESDRTDTTADDLAERVRHLTADLESERAALETLRSDLDSAAGGDQDDSYRERLVASEARRRDLEDRLASLNAVRAAEQRSSADRIAGLERLHLQIGEREERIETLEADLKQTAEQRDEALEDASRLQVEILRLKGELAEAIRRLEVLEEQGEALAEARERIATLEASLESAGSVRTEVERLRKALDAERARAERISRRAAEESHDTTYAMWDRVVRERVDAAVARDTERLTTQVEHLRAVVAEKEARLRALTGTEQVAVERSDLPPITAIKGIGVKIAGILAAHGVATIPAIAALTDEDIDALAEEMPIYPGRIRDDDWVGQARALLDGEIDATEPAPTGPPPITAIKGIGPKIAAILADHGIGSIEDVAALTDAAIDDLAAEMPVYPGRIRDDDWVGQARSLL